MHQIKDSPSKIDQHSCKVEAANDVVQAIKQLRKEIVDIMSQLLLLAKTKNSKGMLPLCTEMMNKTRSLLTMWEPSLVEEAFEFIERHRIIDDPENNVMVSLVFYLIFHNFRKTRGAIWATCVCYIKHIFSGIDAMKDVACLKSLNQYEPTHHMKYVQTTSTRVDRNRMPNDQKT